jgi:diguanylate cyclase (GGDEF)-like protein
LLAAPCRKRRPRPGAGAPDLDNFRHANDALGHQAGDRLILQVVARLKSSSRPATNWRLGSDEFALLIDTRRDANRAEWMAERITEALAEPTGSMAKACCSAAAWAATCPRPAVPIR